MPDPTSRHVPVLLERCVALLAPATTDDGAVLVDGTVGLGGHSEAFLRAFPGLRLVGLDRDVVVIGANTRLEIWDRTTWDSYLETQEPQFAELAEEVLPGVM